MSTPYKRKPNVHSRVMAAKALKEKEGGSGEWLPILGTLGGAAIGAFAGNPMLGASIGSSLGGAAQSFSNDNAAQGAQSLVSAGMAGLNAQTASNSKDAKMEELISRLLSGKTK